MNEFDPLFRRVAKQAFIKGALCGFLVGLNLGGLIVLLVVLFLAPG